MISKNKMHVRCEY